ncbi:hypothetical protein PROSTU_03689 [Providencia stuartii ATCC 25827]|uniref:Uncharacterized protein n=1 Tax=Providencia stuartii ATCC 25827 TaxID=471874 RepID=A0AA87CS31_PROST|nr:hypothetical protein PROSTU_03689 [Providencia stuartii ATCC 25827]
MFNSATLISKIKIHTKVKLPIQIDFKIQFYQQSQLLMCNTC